MKTKRGPFLSLLLLAAAGLAAFGCESYPRVDWQQDPIQAVYTFPRNDATAVSTSARIDAAFSAPLDQSTLDQTTFLLETSSGGTVTGSVLTSGSVATFVPASPLLPSHRYTARLMSGILATNGTSLDQVEWNFTTALVGPETPATVAFRAYQSASQDFNLADGNTPIRFQTEVLDLGGNFSFDATIGTECFVVPEDGVYSFTYGLGKSQAANTFFLAFLSASAGPLAATPQVWAGASGGWRTSGSFIGFFSAGDKVYVLGSTNDAVDGSTEATPVSTSFAGFRVR